MACMGCSRRDCGASRSQTERRAAIALGGAYLVVPTSVCPQRNGSSAAAGRGRWRLNPTLASSRFWPVAGAPVGEIVATLLTFKIRWDRPVWGEQSSAPAVSGRPSGVAGHRQLHGDSGRQPRRHAGTWENGGTSRAALEHSRATGRVCLHELLLRLGNSANGLVGFAHARMPCSAKPSLHELARGTRPPSPEALLRASGIRLFVFLRCRYTVSSWQPSCAKFGIREEPRLLQLTLEFFDIVLVSVCGDRFLGV